MAEPTYLDHCPDCITLPKRLPSSCVPICVAALRNPTEIEDPKCALHCTISLLAWAGGLWINQEDPHPYPQAEADAGQAADELEKLSPRGDPKALNWALIFSALLSLLEQLLNS